MKLSNAAVLEIHDLNLEAEKLAKGSQAERKQADVLLGRIANIRDCGMSSDELRSQYTNALVDRVRGTAAELRARHEMAFKHLCLARDFISQKRAKEELRDLFAGSQEIAYTEEALGGAMVPVVFYQDVITSLAQTDPLMSEDNVNLIKGLSFGTPPMQVSGYDLTSITATRVPENDNTGLPAPQTPQYYPPFAGTTLNGYLYKIALLASFEFEMDDWENVSRTMSRAYGVAFARGIGQDLVNGTGSGQPQGLLTAAADSGVTTGAANTITATDISNIFFSVNRLYRNSPKCAWVMADATYQLIRNAKDMNDRPLLNMKEDMEMLMGKKVLVSPFMPSGPGSKGIVFGDLGHYNVRLSTMFFKRAYQLGDAAAAIENFRSFYIGLMRGDAYLLDPATQASPSNTVAAPIQYATLHS
ncbi:MAG: phage major capsid protein [Candidatus Acidiferrales bacterium]